MGGNHKCCIQNIEGYAKTLRLDIPTKPYNQQDTLMVKLLENVMQTNIYADNFPIKK